MPVFLHVRHHEVALRTRLQLHPIVGPLVHAFAIPVRAGREAFAERDEWWSHGIRIADELFAKFSDAWAVGDRVSLRELISPLSEFRVQRKVDRVDRPPIGLVIRLLRAER